MICEHTPLSDAEKYDENNRLNPENSEEMKYSFMPVVAIFEGLPLFRVEDCRDAVRRENSATYRTAAVAPIVIRAYFSTCRILVKSCCPYEN